MVACCAQEASISTRWRVAILCLVVALGYGGFRLYQQLRRSTHRPNGIVLVIMDTVRADHTSLCGYSRPTTPTLERLAKEGAAYTCEAEAPGSWTLPSHASFFTGQQVLEHAAHELPAHRGDQGAKAVAGTSAAVRPLSKKSTLASQLRKKGYQTVLLAENPVVSRSAGLTRGYKTVHVADSLHQLRGAAVAPYLKKMLDKLDGSEGPLFLTVNLSDAHNNWGKIPEDVGWVPPRGRFEMEDHSAKGFWFQFWNQLIPPQQLSEKLAHMVDSYDYGVWNEDHALGKILELLKADNWCGEGCRVVIVADHGELLGEHGMIQHGWNPWNQNSRVPLMMVGGSEKTLPAPINALHAFHLARDGKLPAQLATVEQPFWPHADRSKVTAGRAFSHTGLIHWNGSLKTIWEDGTIRRYDLATDPMEEHPEVLTELPPGMQERVDKVLAEKGELSWQPGLQESLKALGYME